MRCGYSMGWQEFLMLESHRTQSYSSGTAQQAVILVTFHPAEDVLKLLGGRWFRLPKSGNSGRGRMRVRLYTVRPAGLGGKSGADPRWSFLIGFITLAVLVLIGLVCEL